MPGKLRMLFDELDRLRGGGEKTCLLWTLVLGVSGFQREYKDKRNSGGLQSHRSTRIVLYIQGKTLPFHRLARKISSYIQAAYLE